MSFALIGAVVALLLIAVPVIIAVYATRAVKQRDDQVKAQAATFAASPLADTLVYRVPDGQDPAAVMAALEQEGYAATLGGGAREVHVPCPRGADHDRDHVRAVIADARLNLEGDPFATPVVFEDEQ